MEASEMYEILQQDLNRFARSISRHEHEAQDLLQDAFEKALKEQELGSLPIHKQRAWFFRVMKNRLIDDRRKDQRLSALEDEMEFPEQQYLIPAMEMTELLSQLPPDLSDLVFKRYWLDMTSKEIGEQLDSPAGTIRYKLQNALKILRKKLEEDF